MLDEGFYASVSEIRDAENISKSYVSRMLRLALLAPGIVEAILAGSMDQGVVLEQLEGPLPSSWEEQRRRLGHAPPEPTVAPVNPGRLTEAKHPARLADGGARGRSAASPARHPVLGDRCKSRQDCRPTRHGRRRE
jgi:hypothetical protein